MGTGQPGPKYPKIVHSSEGEMPVSAVRLPSNLILWHMGTSLQQDTTCLYTAELSQIALNSHTDQKLIPHLDTHFQVMILYVPFFTNVFPEAIQPSSEFPHRGTSCLRLAGEGCWDGCKGTCPFSFLFFSPTQIPLLENTTSQLVFSMTALQIGDIFPFKLLFKWFCHLGKRRKRQQENQILYIINL